MNVRDFKNKIFNELASVAKALANPHRLEIIELIAQGPCPVEYIVDNTSLTVANASQHLQTLKSARIVTSEKRGKYSYYSLTSPKVFEAWDAMRELGFSQNAEVGKLMKEFRESRQNLESVTNSQLLERIQQGKSLILDVRPREEYEAGHIITALSIPQDELIEKLKELPKDKEIVAYCRGPLCAMAYDAVKLLKQHGFKANRLESGFPEWMMNNLPVEQNT